MINFTRIGSNHQKPQYDESSENTHDNEKCMKSRNKLEKEGQKGLTGLQGQNPCKNLEGKRQKLDDGA